MMFLMKSAKQTVGLATFAIFAAPLAAQSTVRQVPPASLSSQAAAQLAFGYQCEDKFALRNEGGSPVTVDYVVAGTDERGTVDVRANETVQLESRSQNDLQLYVGGKLVATEAKGNRACADVAVAAVPAVVVRHLVIDDYAYGYGEPVVYVRPWRGGFYAPSTVISVGLGFGGVSRGYGSYGYNSGYAYGGGVRVVRGGGVRGDDRGRANNDHGGYNGRPDNARGGNRERPDATRGGNMSRGDNGRPNVQRGGDSRQQHSAQPQRAQPSRESRGNSAPSRSAPSRSAPSHTDRGSEAGRHSGRSR